MQKSSRLKQIFDEIEMEYIEAFEIAIDREFMAKSLARRTEAGLSPLTEPRNQHLYLLVEKHFADLLPPLEKPTSQELLNRLSEIEKLINEAEDVEKESQKKKENYWLEREIQEAFRKKLHLELSEIRRLKKLREIEADYLRLKEEKQKEEEEKQRLLAAALAALKELFRELKQSQSIYRIPLDNGHVIHIKLADIIQLSNQENLYAQYFKGEITEKQFLAKRKSDIYEVIDSIAENRSSTVSFRRKEVIFNTVNKEMRASGHFQKVMGIAEKIQNVDSSVVNTKEKEEYIDVKTEDTSVRVEETAVNVVETAAKKEDTAVKIAETSQENMLKDHIAVNTHTQKTSKARNDSEYSDIAFNELEDIFNELKNYTDHVTTPKTPDTMQLKQLKNEVEPLVKKAILMENKQENKQKIKAEPLKLSSRRAM